MENLQTMSMEELNRLKMTISEEIANRQKNQLVLYTHSCKGSASYHLRKYAHWAKVVTGVDTTQTNGYAFQGDFLKIEAEHKLPAGSVIVEVCDNSISAYRLSPEGEKIKIAKGKRDSMSSFIDIVATEF